MTPGDAGGSSDAADGALAGEGESTGDGATEDGAGDDSGATDGTDSESGDDADGVPPQTAAAPSDPTGLVVTSRTTTRIDLAWDAANASTAAHRIAYRTGTTPPASCAEDVVVDPTTIIGTAHALEGLLPGQDYTIRVCAVAPGPASLTSTGKVIGASTLASPPPDPTSAVATPVSTTRIDLAWASGGGSTTTYAVAHTSGSTPPSSCEFEGATVTSDVSLSLTGLAPGTPHAIRICARNGNPLPDASPGVVLTSATLAPPPPDPTALSATGASTASLSLSWSSGGGSTSGYRIAYREGAAPPDSCASDTVVDSPSISGTEHVLVGLSPGREHGIRVCAVNANPSADESAGATLVAATWALPPPVPLAAQATAVSPSRIDLTWASGGGSTTSFRIAYRAGTTPPESCASDTVVAVESISGMEHSLTGLDAGQEYRVLICAANANPIPDVSEGASVAATTWQLPPPDPQDLVATALSSDVIALSWTSGGGSTSSYRIAYRPGTATPVDCTDGVTLDGANITGTTANVASLAPATGYSFRICAVNANDPGDVSSGITTFETTEAEPAPPNPATVSGYMLAPGTARLSWSSGGGTTAGYRIAYDQGHGVPPASCAHGTLVSEAAISGTSHDVTGLDSAHHYSFRVCATNANPTPDVSSGLTRSLYKQRPIHIAYYGHQFNQENQDLVYATNQGGVWTKSVLDTAGNTGIGPSIVHNPDTGAVHVAFYRSNGPGDSGLMYATNQSGSWVVSLLDADAAAATTAIAINRNHSGTLDRLHVVYVSSTGTVKHAHKNETGLTWTIASTTATTYSGFGVMRLATYGTNGAWLVFKAMTPGPCVSLVVLRWNSGSNTWTNADGGGTSISCSGTHGTGWGEELYGNLGMSLAVDGASFGIYPSIIYRLPNHCLRHRYFLGQWGDSGYSSAWYNEDIACDTDGIASNDKYFGRYVAAGLTSFTPGSGNAPRPMVVYSHGNGGQSYRRAVRGATGWQTESLSFPHLVSHLSGTIEGSGSESYYLTGLVYQTTSGYVGYSNANSGNGWSHAVTGFPTNLNMENAWGQIAIAIEGW